MEFSVAPAIKRRFAFLVSHPCVTPSPAQSRSRRSRGDKGCETRMEVESWRKGMKDCRLFYINGEWVSPTTARDFIVINPANEEPLAAISLGGAADVDKAVAAAKRAFESYSETTTEERLAFLQQIIEVYKSKIDEMAETISKEMGAPITLSKAAQAPVGLSHFLEIVKVLRQFKFEEQKGSTLMRNEPTRMLVPRSKMAEVASIAKRAAEATKSGDPFKDGTSIGPLASKAQFEKVQGLITK